MQYKENKEIKAFFTLLQAGLWEKAPEDLSVFPLSAEQWTEIFNNALQQTVTGIIYQGISLLPDELMPSEEQLMRWVIKADKIERKNRHMNKVIRELCGWFEKNGLNPIILKGQGVAQFYEHPLLRECGDIDLYFQKPEDNTKAISLIKAKGWKVKSNADGSVSYFYDGIEIEHHTYAIDLQNKSVQETLRQMEETYGYEKVSLTDNTTILTPTPNINLVLQNAHILKHTLGWGIGLRQLCDLARTCHRTHGKTDAEFLMKVSRLSGIDRWTQMLHTFLTDYLLLPEQELPYRTEKTSVEPLLERIIKGGNFGHFRADRDTRSKNHLKRRLQTARSFMQNISFAYRYAPREAASTFIQLAKGQH